MLRMNPKAQWSGAQRAKAKKSPMRPSHWQRRSEVGRAGISVDQKAVDETGRSRLEMTSVLWGLSCELPSFENPRLGNLP
jgi:hypothetical protein